MQRFPLAARTGLLAVMFAFCAARTEALDSLFVIAPTNATEGVGILVNQGHLILPSPLSSNLTVTLSSSDTSEVTVPPTLTLLVGETNKTFDITIVDDGLIDGAQTATITAHAENWNDGAASITVLDDETLNLTVILVPSAYENTGVISSAGTVLLSGTLATNITISLLSSDTTELTVPSSMTLLAGRSNRVFNITLIDDALVDGAQNVTVTASAPGLVSGSAIVMVLDNESPPLPSNPNPADLATNVSINADLSWVNGQAGLNNDVYFGTNPVPNQLLGTTSGNTWNLPQLLPNTTYYWQIVARAAGSSPSGVWRFTTRDVDHFDFGPIASQQVIDQPFPVTITARDELNRVATNFTGPVALRAFLGGVGNSNSILASPVHDSVSSGDFSLGYSFTPNTNITVTAVRHYFGTKVSIWTDSGILLIARTVSSVPGTWIETPLPTAIQLTAGTRYRVAAYSGGSAGSYYWQSFLAPNFPNGTIDAAYEVNGDAFPNAPDAERWFVDLRYIIGSSSPAMIAPTNSGNFTNGIWSGNVTALQPATNMVLVASDIGGHTGASAAFNVLVGNDLSVSIADRPDPVGLGGFLTNIVAVTNSGPGAATGVTTTNLLPATVSFVSAISSQGSCALVAGRVECSLGTLAGGGGATVTIVTSPNASGQITNRVTIGRAEADGYAGNNFAESVTTVLMPSLSVLDAAGSEGNSGLSPLMFSVRLSPPSSTNVTVSFTTANGTAIAGSDYVSTNGVLSFTPGQTNQSITVQLIGDTTGEANETFSVVLSGAVNASISKTSGVGTIFNDDVPPNVYLRSTTGSPWGQTANETAMGRVFGTTNWQDLRYETVNPAAVFSPVTRFVFMEGSDANALELQSFLSANLALIENWVAAGGRLFLNAAPNEGSGMYFGFGVNLIYSDATGTGNAASPLHPIFQGPFTPVGLTWTGNSFGHATVTNISGASLTVLITNTLTGRIVLGQKPFGGGLVLFGGMTTDNFHSPQPQGSNLRANIISYTANFVSCTNCAPTIVNQPASQYIRPGTNVTFSVGASGTAPLVYQWRRNGTNLTDGGRISGATSPVLMISNGVEDDSGLISVIVSNAFGFSTSLNATLTVNPLDHFTWLPVPSPQIVNSAFPVTIEARDFLDRVVTNFVGSVGLSGRNVQGASNPVAPTNSGNFTAGVWSGNIAVLAAATNMVLIARDANARTGQSNPFHVTSSNQPPIFLTQPVGKQVGTGSVASLFVSVFGTPPLSYQWRFNGTNLIGETTASLVFTALNTNQSGNYSVVVSNAFGSVTSANAFLTIFDAPPEFQIAALLTSNSRVVDHNVLTGDDRGGIAVSTNRVLYSGDNSTARFALSDLSGGAALGTVYDALVSDLRSGNIYSLGNGGTPLTSIGGTATTLLQHDGNTGIPNGSIITLSAPINLTGANGNVGIFAGYGQILLYNGSRMYAIALPLGLVTDLGAMVVPNHQFTENWAYWGVAEYVNGVYSVVYVRDSQTIVRTTVPTGPTTTLASFSNLSDMAAITVSVPHNRWYFHYEGSGQFGGTSETLGYADAILSTTATPPVLLVPPFNQIAVIGGTATFSVTAGGALPLRYQWQKDGTNIPGATSRTYTILNAQSNLIGNYSVVVTNSFGAFTSPSATLTVLPASAVVAVFDDPVYVDTAGTSDSESDNLQATALALGYPAIPFTDIISAASSYQRIIVPEQENGPLAPDLSPAARAALSNFVFTGGKLIVHGTFNGLAAASLLNTVFGFTVEEVNNTGFSHNLTEQAIGTAFADDPATILDNSATTVLLPLSLPPGSFPMYTNSTGSGVVVISQGDGFIMFLGWDWFNAKPAGTVNGGWLNVLESALNQNALPPRPATITASPPSRTAFIGGVVTFSVGVFGTAPLAYQWLKGGTNIPNATNATYSIVNLQTNDAGDFSVIVTNLYGSDTSAVAVLTVIVDPGFFDDFEPGIDPVQWSTFSSLVRATNYGGSVSGANSLWFGGDGGSRFAESRPLDTHAGGTVEFYLRIASSNAEPWEIADLPDEGIVLEYSINDGVNWIEMGRYDTSFYTNWTPVVVDLPLAAQTFATRVRWRQLFSSGACCDHWALDDVAVVTGPRLPRFTVQPANQAVLPGTNVTLVSAATGTGPLRYQWRFEGVDIANATNATYSFTNASLANHGNYSVAVTDDIGTTVSATAFINVLIRPTILVQPQSQTVAQGQTAVFTVVASGAPPLYYRWIRGGFPYLTSSVPMLVLTNNQSNTTVRVAITNLASGLGGVNSTIAQLIVLPDFDQDGMADAWETQYGLNTNNAADALGDLDSDGMSNHDEFVAGTNPTDPLSLLKLTVTTTNSAVLQFVAQPNIAYTIQYQTNLTLGTWSNLMLIGGQSQSRTVQVNTPTGPTSLQFYRVATPPVP